MTARKRESRVDRPPGWAAWLVSLVVHTCLLVSLAITTRALFLRGIQQGPTTNLVLGLADESPNLAGEEAAVQSETASDESTEAESGFLILPAAPDSAASVAPPRAPGLSLLGLNVMSPASGASSNSAQGSASPRLSKLEAKARLSVFGAVAEGTKFVFVFDRSTSMAGAPLAAAKQQLVASLEALDSVHQFQVIFFNHEVQAWDLTGGQRRIPLASDSNKELARRFVAGVTAAGGTYRRTPLLRALAMSPDAVFFLTDADDAMPAYDVVEAVSRAERSGTAIACIEFGEGPAAGGENFLTQLARATGGAYVYIDTTALEAR